MTTIARLPFTGPSTQRVLLWAGLLVVMAGAVLLVGTTTRGRHVRRRPRHP